MQNDTAPTMFAETRWKPDRTTKLTDLMNVATDSYMKVIKNISQAYKAYNMDLRDDIQQAFKTRSRYMDNSFSILVEDVTDVITRSLPLFIFNISNKYDGKTQLNLYRHLTKKLAETDLKLKIQEGVFSSLLSSLFMAEVEFTEKSTYGTKLDVKDGELTEEQYTISEGGKLSLKIFDAKKHEILIDPLASSFNITETAQWIIVRDAVLSKEEVEDIYKVDLTDIPPVSGVINEFGDVINTKGYLIHKLYRKDGRVDTFLNKSYQIDSKRNSLGFKDFPLIAFSLNPWHEDVYGKNIFQKLKQSIYFKSGIINLITTSAIKNITAPIITDSAILAKQGSLADVTPDEIIPIERDNNGNAVNTRFAQLHWVDMTPGLQSLYGIISQEEQKESRMSALANGVQDKVVRSNQIAETMMQSNQNFKSTILTIIETKLYQRLGEIFLRIMYEKYPLIKGMEQFDRDMFLAVDSFQVVNGSLERGESYVQSISELFQIAAQMPSSFSVTDIITEYFLSKGLNIKAFQSSPDEELLKNLIAMGLSPQQAQSAVQQLAGAAQQNKQPQQAQRQPQGGQR